MREQFVELNKRYRNLSKSKKPADSQQVVEKTYTDAQGHEVKVSQLVKRKVFPDEATEALYDDLKKKRKEILRFHKNAILYVNMLVEKIIHDFIESCQPTVSGKKVQEKTFGWKQFNKHVFSQSFCYSLILSSKFFNDFMALKQTIGQLANEKEIQRLKANQTKMNSTTVQQDIARYKSIMLARQPTDTDEQLQQQLVEEFGETWSVQLGHIYTLLDVLQQESVYSRFLFNTVKTVSRVFHSEDNNSSIKVSNGFKNMIAKIVREFLLAFSAKIQVYLDDQPNHQLKMSDVKKIIRLWASLDSTEALKLQLDEFDRKVDAKLAEIAQLKQQKQ